MRVFSFGTLHGEVLISWQLKEGKWKITNGTNIWELAEYSKYNKRIKRAKYLFVLFVRSICSKPAENLSVFLNFFGKLRKSREYTVRVVSWKFSKRNQNTFWIVPSKVLSALNFFDRKTFSNSSSKLIKSARCEIGSRKRSNIINFQNFRSFLLSISSCAGNQQQKSFKKNVLQKFATPVFQSPWKIT